MCFVPYNTNFQSVELCIIARKYLKFTYNIGGVKWKKKIYWSINAIFQFLDAVSKGSLHGDVN